MTESDTELMIEKELAELDAIKRIIDYLQFNNFKNLEDAEAKGWGDTSPLTVQPDHRSEQKQ